MIKKFKVEDEQLILNEQMKDLYRYVTLIECEENKKNFLAKIATSIDKGTIFDDPQNRKIKVEKLNEEIRKLSNSYTGNEIKLEEPSEEYEQNNISVNDENYVIELKKIEINDKPELFMNL